MSKSLDELLARAEALGMTETDLPVLEAEVKGPQVEALQAEVARLQALLGVEPTDLALERDAAADELAELLATSSAPGEDPAADAEAEGGVDFEEPAGVDFDDLPDLEDEPDVGDLDGVVPTGEEKAAGGFGPCPVCGSTARDEFADGTARCEEDGTLLPGSEVKALPIKTGVDFDDLEPELEAKAAPADAPVDITDLLARRAALGV